MDLMNLGLLVGSVWCVYEMGSKFVEPIVNIYDNRGGWGEAKDGLGLTNYKVFSKKNTSWGFILTMKVCPGGSIAALEELKDHLQKIFNGKITIKDIPYSNLCEIIVITKPVGDLKYKFMELSPYQFLIGYTEIGEPIIVDMLITPHIGCIGLSNNGKSKCIELGLKNLRGADIHLVNCMAKDFVGLGRRINGDKEIMDYLKEMSEETKVREKPLYIVIDEYNVLSKIKGVDKAIQDLLSQARHRNTFIICIGQLGQKEDMKFKNLFNCRLAFRCIEESSIRAFLGCTVDDVKLNQREFILLSTELYRGKTYML